MSIFLNTNLAQSAIDAGVLMVQPRDSQDQLLIHPGEIPRQSLCFNGYYTANERRYILALAPLTHPTRLAIHIPLLHSQ